MKLLIFAHRGEAQIFFAEWELSPINFYFTGLFKNKDHYLLITGEGMKDASEKTVAVLAKFKDEITQVINIGIAGSLSNKTKIGDLIWVRSSYAQSAKNCEFKSYTMKYHNAIDCMTAHSRITSTPDRQMLSHFADIVDRELWSIASAAHLFKVDFLSLKLISDDMYSNDICQLVKEEAPRLSRSLFDEYANYLKSLDQKKAIEQKVILPGNNLLNFIELHPRLYFTATQTRKLSQLLRGFELKNSMPEKEIKNLVSSIIEENFAVKTSKEMSKILLNALNEKLHPFNTKVKEKISISVKPLLDAGATVVFDSELEHDYLNIHFQMHSIKDQRKLQLALEQFNYQKIKDIFAGKVDDEI